MPHATADDEDDNAIIGRLLAGGPMDELGNFTDRQLDLGEKANDAEDFEDIGDDDLAEDEENPTSAQQLNQVDGEAQPLINEPAYEDDGEGFDDLFGDHDHGSPPHAGYEDGVSPAADQSFADGTRAPATQDQQMSFESATAIDSCFPEEFRTNDQYEEEEEEDPEVLEQMRLFQQAQRDREVPPAPQTDAELFSIIFPQFEADKPPRFSELIPGKRAQYLNKRPPKPPKPVHPTKVNLELRQDDEKSFRLPGPATTSFAVRKAEAEANGLVLTSGQEDIDDQSDDVDIDEFNSDHEEDVGIYKWQDLVAVCQDWSIPMESPLSSDSENPQSVQRGGIDATLTDAPAEDTHSLLVPTSKKRKLGSSTFFTSMLSFSTSHVLFDQPEDETARLSKKVRLDMNDPYMLIDVQEPSRSAERKRRYGQFKRDNARGLTKDFARRYNISNDDAYDQLKENRQSKIRSTLGGLAIEHSLPAARLQYPFYKVKLSSREARSFHRPTLGVDPVLVRFSPLKHYKRKEQRRKTPQELFATTPQLSQGDNAHVLLLEYSEEYPAMLSGFGMGNRLVNYYRRKDEADHSRPKHDVGETEVLTREDKSPFSIFGDVDPGSTQRTISNGMYRAPVFAHDTGSQDFLLVSNKTSSTGRHFYLKNMENLHVVGQEFPSVEVPGTHSRKVTDASKKRLRMLSYRMYRKHKKLKNEMILSHLPGSDIAQNRSKMREFMNYDKDKGWLPRETEVPEEATIRGWIKPEDICLLESMQVGDRQLKDAGYNKDDDLSEDDDREGQSVDQQLAPWQTTKNFLNACQGKAMLQLHGEGDPSGRGEAFNFIRTSMKGGFKAIGESVNEHLSGKNPKELGGHSYNVAKQQRAYNDAIRKIWDAQRNSLSSTENHDVDIEDQDDLDAASFNERGRTPSSFMPGRSRRDDETASMFSRTSMGSQSGKVLRIIRNSTDKYGIPTSEEQVVRDPKIIREYLKRRQERQLSRLRSVLKYIPGILKQC